MSDHGQFVLVIAACVLCLTLLFPATRTDRRWDGDWQFLLIWLAKPSKIMWLAHISLLAAECLALWAALAASS